ncbi:hypothetical protein BsWGS_24205 [Bradybaena similaris]
MASGSRQSGLEAKSESSLLDPSLFSWMSRDSQQKVNEISEDDESRKKDKESECEIRELFRIFDRDRDNKISGPELGKMLRCMGMNVADENVDALMKELDTNCNGKVEFREFKAFVQEEMRKSENPNQQEKAIRLAFKVFDENEEGVIDEEHLKKAMKNLGEPLTDKELDDMLKLADRDQDGKINYEEFIKLWLHPEPSVE